MYYIHIIYILYIYNIYIIYLALQRFKIMHSVCRFMFTKKKIVCQCLRKKNTSKKTYVWRYAFWLQFHGCKQTYVYKNKSVCQWIRGCSTTPPRKKEEGWRGWWFAFFLFFFSFFFWHNRWPGWWFACCSPASIPPPSLPPGLFPPFFLLLFLFFFFWKRLFAGQHTSSVTSAWSFYLFFFKEAVCRPTPKPCT